jgi:membrane protein DedA with SNARE-associated domain
MEFLFRLTQWRLAIASFALMLANGFASFPPSEFVWAGAGGACASGDLQPVVVIVAGIIGDVLGTTLLYVIARVFGPATTKRVALLTARRADRLLTEVESIFAQRGPVVVLAFRCVPTLRSIISAPAGVARMNVTKFLLYTTAGCTIWGVAWFFVGYLLGIKAISTMNLHRRELIIANTAILFVLIMVVCGTVARRLHKTGTKKIDNDIRA